ncbi:MAG: hypothetical protein QNJ63_03795 [Calothrix sp. MO_192.B10]|nr:hypothetical protein [Calothrix sp. MO_192.B10]
MFNYLLEATELYWMGIYLRVLACVFAYGAIVHAGNMAGLGGKPWLETPSLWRIADIVYLILDIAAVIGLWQRKVWGIGLFLLAFSSQFVLYTIFIDYFASNSQEKQTIYGLLGTEAILILIFLILFLTKK